MSNEHLITELRDSIKCSCGYESKNGYDPSTIDYITISHLIDGGIILPFSAESEKLNRTKKDK